MPDTAETVSKMRPDSCHIPVFWLLDQQRLTLSALSFETGLTGIFFRPFFNITPESSLFKQGLFA
jgi:hypothetical protein